MKFNMQSILWKSGLLLIAGMIVLACAEERDPIDRVQPYALKKEFFIGPDYTDTRDDPEFWGRTTVTDVGYGANQELLFPSTIGQNVARLKWTITEDHLIARASYERINASDGLGAPKKDIHGNAIGSETHDGQVVAMFRIQSHFDIANDYNPVTGEKMNVVGENSFDRPWYERDYIRVDWSRNEATDTYDFDVLSFLNIFGTTYEPIAYYVDDPNDPDAPVFDLDNGYFDVTTKAFATPGMIDLSSMGWGISKYPACFLPLDFFGGSFPMGNCNPIELTLRHSFRRVVDTDFEPTEHDGGRFTTFGGFVTERYGYARNYGMTDNLHHRLLNRYNIWQRSHYYDDSDNMTGEVPCFTPDTTQFGEDPHRDLNNDGTEDECEKAGEGSRCDTFKQKCTLPFRQRVEKPLVWYYSTGSDLRYFEPSDLAAHEWDVALRVAVQAARYAECKRTGGGSKCDTDYPIYHGQIDDGWDAIALAREVDACRRTDAGIADPTSCNSIADSVGKARGYDPGVIAIAKMPEMVVLCHSPVQAHDPMVCGERRLPTIKNDKGETVDATGEDCTWAINLDEDEVTDEIAALIESCKNATVARLGDLRFDTINVFHQPQTPSPWGIMVSAIDPTTGENISTSANVWSWVNDYWSQLVVDQMRVIKGDLDPKDITGAEFVRDYGRATEAASRGGVAGTMSKELVESRVFEFATGKSSVQELEAAKSEWSSHKITASQKAAIQDFQQKFRTIVADAEKSNTAAPIYAARRAALAGTEIEAEMMSEPVRQLYGVNNLPLTEEVMNIASPLRGGARELQIEMKRLIQNNMHKRGMCILDASMAEAPLSVANLADVMEEKFGKIKGASQETLEKMRDYIARKAHYSVVTHEMGHSIAHRHNFVSSSDSWNFRPQYWQLRTKDGTVTEECTALDKTGENCVGPRYFDPVTDAEAKGMIWMWQHSSVMEYPGETTQDFLGIGAYDFAATRLFYGDVTDVLMDDMWKSGKDSQGNFTYGAGAREVLNKLNNSFGGLTGYSYDIGHYSLLNKAYKLIDNCKAVTNLNAFKPANWDKSRNGEWSPLLDGLLVSPNGDGKYTRCKQQKVDYVPWTSLKPFIPSEASQLGGGMKEEYLRNNLSPEYKWGDSRWGVLDQQNRVLAPYGFATDRWADIGNVMVYRHDNGADPYEIFNFMSSQREMSHIWDAYRRNRAAFSVRSYMGRILERYNAKMRDGAKGMALYRTMAEDYGLRSLNNSKLFWESIIDGQFQSNVLAAGMVFDNLTRELARPQSGAYDYFPASETEFKNDPNGVLYSWADGGFAGNKSPWEAIVNVPDGPFIATDSRYFGAFSPGAALVENQLAEGQGDYDAEYTMTAGSYYNKLNTGYLLCESADNFISDSLMDFVDARYRAVSLALLFPEGYRRLVGNMLTGDTALKGPRVAAGSDGLPLRERVYLEDPSGNHGVNDKWPWFLSSPIGWVTWWGESPRACFPAPGTPICQSFGDSSGDVVLDPQNVVNSKVLDPQVGWEQQKWLYLDSLIYLRENEKYDWYDQMAVYQLGKNSDPGFTNRIEFHDPDGRVYVARTYGKETIFGKEVEKGIAARVLQYANELLYKGYETTAVDNNGDGVADWYLPVYKEDGTPVVKYDPRLKNSQRSPGCDAKSNEGCICEDNLYCVEQRNYKSLLNFMFSAYMILFNDQVKGIY